ncbi:serine/threonine protein kinase [Nonomuraea solani]|uniref:Serine/threonine protein kinase n=1 Tax=Nonomuraea solani TaxID=1144553 RepID=A0A1H5TX32_9ACTN|nr:septum formation initiator [Nonomuraea solani]SEF67290.1 serine/threonine protein kinase [Nonomuraea solani]
MKRLVLAWAATATAATGAAVAVLGLLGNGLTGTSSHVLTRPEVRAALATATPRAAGPSGTAPAQTSPGKLIRSAGGTVIAACTGDQVTLRSWSPAQDYSVDGVEPGPALEAKVEFEPPEGEEIELTIACSGGRPVVR